MSFLAGPLVGAATGVIGSIAGNALGGALAPSIDPNQFKSPFDGKAGQRVEGQIGGLNAMNQQAFRNAQLGQLGYLQQQAQGKGPSIAQMQTDRAMQAAAAQQMAQAQGVGAQNAGLARRLAAQNTAAAQGDIAGQGMLARLQEIQNANQMLAQAAQAGRGQDLGSQGLAQNYEQLLAQAALSAQDQRLKAMQTNLGAQQEMGKQVTSAMAGGLSGGMKLFG